MYYPEAQLGTNPCRLDSGGCQHLCFGLSPTQHVCKCSIGYYVDPQYPRKCLGEEEFLLYSIGHELKGFRLNDPSPVSESTRVLGPLSRVALASVVDYHARNDQIFWADNEKGTITSIRRDGTERNTLVKFFDQFESSADDWLNGIAVDWLAENIYWSVAKRNLIEVARLNGSSRYVVLSQVDAPKAIAVDPVAGYLFYAGDKRIGRTGLDGSQLFILANKTSQVTSLAVDINNQVVYWCETNTNVIMRVDYDGNSKTVMLNHSLEHPVAVAVLGNTLYWADNAHEKGSIKAAPITNLSDFTVLVKNEGSSLQDLKVFTQQIQKGTNPCGTNNGGCAQLCLFNGTHPICACSYSMLSTDGKSCVDYDKFLVYSLITSIESIHMTNTENLNGPLKTIRHAKLLRNAIALSYDYERNRIYYSDLSWSTINMVHFNGTNHTVIVSKQPSVEGLAYEPITNTLFWTSNNVATIRALNMVGMSENISSSNESSRTDAVKTIIRLNPHDKPRGLAVESCLSMVYWTNWNTQAPAIQRAYISGYGMESIIKTDIRMPNAITMDTENHKLYWADARLDKVERADYDGGNRIVLTHSMPKHPFSIAIYGDLLFWTDWALGSVVRANKYTGTDVVRLRKDIGKPMGIVAVQNTTKSCSASPCEVLNGGCEDVCNVVKGQIKCECTQGNLSPDGRSCIRSRGSCSSDQFFCKSGECIPYHLTCDHINHCMDGSDEVLAYCSLRSCPPLFFRCDNHRCIPTNQTCDGIQHCGDGSDEAMCDCGEQHFKCPSGQCIQIKYRCDMDIDCPDGADEMFCPHHKCNDDWEKCTNSTGCFMPQWRCDGEPDCFDKTDELDCPTKTCSEEEFQCDDGLCIALSWRCDRDPDCNDGFSDERDCFLNETQVCKPTQFACADGKGCIAQTWQCDEVPDCEDGSDEGKYCGESTCFVDQFRCPTSGRCIPRKWVCDGDSDCGTTNDDEKDCPEGVSKDPCTYDMFQCLSGQCIGPEFYCDGSLDCDDGTDEYEGCEEMKYAIRGGHCDEDEFLCENGKCLPIEVRCNLKDDCGDGSDERHELCINSTLLCAAPQFYRCGMSSQ